MPPVGSLWTRSYPAGIPVDVDIPNVSVPAKLKEAVDKFPAHDAIIFALRPGIDKRWTYTELWDEIGHFAAGLAQRGFAKGDRLALYLPNCPEYVIAYYAALRLGLTVVQVSPLYIADDLVTPLKDSGAKGVVTLDFLSHHLEEVKDRVNLGTVIVGRLKNDASFLVSLMVNRGLRKQKLDPRLPTKIPYVPFREVLACRETVTDAPIDPAKDVAVFQYTGGTTGQPKAAMLTHRNLVANTVQAGAWFTEARPGDERVLAVIPFFHVYGMTVAMNYPLFNGATLVVNPQRPNPGFLLPFFGRYKVTQFPGVPSLYNAINNHPEVSKYPMGGLRICLSGSAPLPLEVSKKFEELTGGYLIEGYGLSETSPATHANPIRGKRKVGSIGLALPSTDMRIVDSETGSRVLAVGEEGELAIKGPQVMLGYWNRPEENARSLRDGWFFTGDIAKMDEEGYVYIVDRKKDIIIVGGFKVFPREVEEVLYQHPAVADAAALGVPDPVVGEAVKAYIVLKPGASATEKDIIDFVKTHVAHYKAPRSVEFRDALPKTLVGKVLKRSLREAPTAAPEPPKAAA